MTICPTIRAKVIEMAQKGNGRNQIVYELSLANIKVSSGSVSNILKEWKNQSVIVDSIEIKNDQMLETSSSCPKTNETFTSNTQVPEQQQQSELEEQMKTKRDELSQLEIEELHLEELKRMAQDFAVVKQEMIEADMGGPDSAQFVNVIHEFRKYGYSPTKIMKVFAEIIDIKHAREELKRQRKEVEEQREVLDRKLEEMGFGDLEKLTQTVAVLTTLSQYGIDCDKIISISTNLSNYQLRRQQWERKVRDGWDVNDNNGHQQGYNNDGYNSAGY